jgi:hypothetical protein
MVSMGDFHEVFGQLHDCIKDTRLLNAMTEASNASNRNQAWEKDFKWSRANKQISALCGSK